MRHEPSALKLAAWLLEQETEGSSGTGELAEATGRVCCRLHQQFAQLVGVTGCDLLLARALSVATTADPLLAAVRWQPGRVAGLDGLRERLEARPLDEARRACTAIVGAFLDLLFTF